MPTKKQSPTNDQSWVNDEVPENEIDYNDDGSEFIPIPIVEGLLSKVDVCWGTENFKFRIFSIGERTFASGSLELVLMFFGRLRRVVGAATIEIISGDNVEAIIKSESIKNSSKVLGKRFGRDLNGRGDMLIRQSPSPTIKKNGKQKPPAVKKDPDEKMQAQYNKAVDTKQDGLVAALNEIYNIQYTGTNNVKS